MPIDWWLIAFCIHAIAIAIAARASIKTPLGRGCTKVQRAIPVRGRRAAPGNGTFVLCVMERESGASERLWLGCNLSKGIDRRRMRRKKFSRAVRAVRKWININ
jgi:hypothetical protein